MRPQARTVSAMQPAAVTRHASVATFHVNDKTKSFHQNVLSHPVRNPTLNWQGVAEGQEALQRHAKITIHHSETDKEVKGRVAFFVIATKLNNITFVQMILQYAVWVAEWVGEVTLPENQLKNRCQRVVGSDLFSEK